MTAGIKAELDEAKCAAMLWNTPLSESHAELLLPEPTSPTSRKPGVDRTTALATVRNTGASSTIRTLTSGWGSASPRTGVPA
jgi:hypothetical protein